MPSHRHIRPLHIDVLEDRSLPSTTNMIAFGADAGGGPHVRVLDAETGAEIRSFFAYDPSFRGGVRVAVGDVTGDGVPDIVTAAGPGGGPHVKVFDGRTGAVRASFFADDPSFTGGVNLAVGDVTGDGVPDIVTAPARAAAPQVRVFDLKGREEARFLAYATDFLGGVSVAVGDVNGDRTDDIITAAGPGGGPHVKVFAGGSSGIGSNVLANFFAFDPTFRGGVSVATGDFDGNGLSEIATGAGAGGGPHVKVFSGLGDAVRASFFAFASTFSGGVCVGATDTNGDGRDELVAATGPGRADCRIFDGTRFQLSSDIPAFPGFTGGSWVGGNVNHAIAEANRDAVLDWNSIALDAIRVDRTPPPKASRHLAMVQAAVYDAVNAIAPLHDFYLANPGLHPNADMTAAVSAAAHRVLSSLYPAQASTLDAAIQRWLDKVPDGPAETEGFILGRQTANAILAARANDGSNTTVPYTPGSDPGDWQPTPPANAAALLPQWPSVTPFTMTSGSQFRASGPPALTSQEYADAVNEVKSLGAANSTTRTTDQTEIALFWADGGGTMTPPGHWNQIARQVSLQQGLSLAENARLFALLGLAEADAAISCWDSKYQFDFWRPITAIRNAASDGNDLTDADPNWTSLIVTPNFPTYTSGHSTFSGAAAAVLGGFFGRDSIAFTDRGDVAQVYTRSFTGFNHAADEAALSRLYGGIHFRFDNADGLTAGRALGQYVVSSFLQ